MSMWDACSRCGERYQGRCTTCGVSEGTALCGQHLLKCAQLGHRVVIDPFGKDDLIDPELKEKVNE